jgi:enediyne biosynthesis protein E4
VQIEQAKRGMSYMSASDPRIHFGLGKGTKIVALEITWPNGQFDRLTNVPIDQIITVREGAGIIQRQFPKFPSSK